MALTARLLFFPCRAGGGTGTCLAGLPIEMLGHQNVGKAFVVAEQHVVAGGQALDQVGFEQQRFGFGMGGVVPMQGAVVGAAFGRASFGRVLGAMRPPMAVIHLAGDPFEGWIYDTTGDYTAAFTTFIVLYLFAAAAVMGISVNTKANRGLN